MGLLLAIIAGAFVGWRYALILQGRVSRRRRSAIILGVLGSLLGAFLLGPVIGGGNLLEASLDLRTIIVGLTGATILLALVHAYDGRRGMTSPSRRTPGERDPEQI